MLTSGDLPQNVGSRAFASLDGLVKGWVLLLR